MTEEHSYIIIVAGTPGTGKTTISLLLSKELQCRFIDSSKLFVEKRIAREDPTGRHTHVIDNSSAIKFITKIIHNNSCYIVETHYPILWINTAESDIAFTILLRAHPIILYDRLKQKRWPIPKIIENSIAEATNIVAEELYEWSHMTFEVDTSRKYPKETINEIFNLIYEWKTGIRIDWLLADENLTTILSRWLVELDRYKYGFRE